MRRLVDIPALAAMLLVLLACLPMVAGPAAAEPLLMRLFGIGRPAEPKAPVPPATTGQGKARVLQVPRDGVRAPSPAAAGDAAKTLRPKVMSVPEVRKADDAQVVLVIGDRLAGDLARGLEAAFAESPDVRVESNVIDLSGLRDQTPVNWRDWLEQRLATEPRPVAVAVMAGLNDAAAIDIGGKVVEFPSADWETIYRARIRGVMEVARSAGVRLDWLGLVPTADGSQTSNLIYVDSLIRGEVRGDAAFYVDVWDAFSEPGGGFTASGPDVGGQVRQLRLKDGVGFSRSGARKLAFFVEQDLKAWLKTSAATAELARAEPADGLVVMLNDPASADEDELAAAGDAKPPLEGTPLYQLVVEGLPLAPRPGRVDDLSVH